MFTCWQAPVHRWLKISRNLIKSGPDHFPSFLPCITIFRGQMRSMLSPPAHNLTRIHRKFSYSINEAFDQLCPDPLHENSIKCGLMSAVLKEVLESMRTVIFQCKLIPSVPYTVFCVVIKLEISILGNKRINKRCKTMRGKCLHAGKHLSIVG